jgi:uncharacterized protein YkwD
MIFLFTGLDDVIASSYESELLQLINQHRIQNGVRPLISDNKLKEIAKSHSRHMYSANRLSHDNFNERFFNSGSKLCVENVGWNAVSAEHQFRLWKESVLHDANMLKKDIQRAGISIVGNFTTFFACQ